MHFEFPQRMKLAKTPTPIEKLEQVTRMFEGPQIYMKRDDLTGLVTTGNKIRKLEFLLAEAVEQGADYVITCGGIQSNHARTTAAAAAKLGLQTHLILRNGQSPVLEGNLFLDRLLGAEVEYVTPEDYEQIDELMAQRAEALQEQGHRPYIIPEGGSNELGTLGYVLAARELAEQLRERKLRVDHIVTAVGSGGTYAGLLLGKFLYDLPAQIHGINVCDDAAYFRRRVSSLVNRVQKRFGGEVSVPKEEIRIIDGYVGKGYGLSRAEEIDLIKQVAHLEGIVLDPVYTGKALYGVKDQIRRGRFRADETVLFIHTGGVFGVFPKSALFF